MQIHQTGEIGKDFYSLGIAAVPVFLMDGPAPALFDAGFAALAPVYEKEIKQVLGDRSPAYLFITHAHWDHIGAAGYFRELWPEMVIAGPSRIREILSRPGALRSIKSLSHDGAHDLRYWGESSIQDIPFRSFDLDLILTPDQSVELSADCHVKVIHTPGHTWDLMSYWISERKILVASEAVATAHGDRLIPEFLVDYDAYRRSLGSIAALEPEILCLAHRAVLTGPDVKPYLKRSLEEVDAFVVMVEQFLLEEKGDIERTVARVKDFQWDDLPYPKQPEPAYLLNTRARVAHVRDRMERQGRGPGK
jgi:glyoxylase-like metal-dependent hydrolase (beta-lactamase superfamily II)